MIPGSGSRSVSPRQLRYQAVTRTRPANTFVGMDSRPYATKEDLYGIEMEVKQLQYTQSNHGDRLMRLEKRQADDVAIKSAWNSPFPGVLSGTPQHGPVPQEDLFDDLDEQGEQLLSSLHLGPTEEEPVRRGAASRANSVRFDESALHGSSWAGHNSRHSGDFGPARPASSLMMERTLSHKSDGRHSSAGHSVHSHMSVASGRASSLGLDTHFGLGDEDDDASLGIPEPPASFFVLGSVPSIVRCWLTKNYAHSTLLYADICTGSQKSTVDYALMKELDLLEEIERDHDGTCRARLSVYFAEATVIQHSARSHSPERTVPSMTTSFEVTGMDSASSAGRPRSIGIFIGSDALRAHSADVLFSKNTMLISGDDRSRLRVPFIRPEDEDLFRFICTTNALPEKPKLNANAAPFVISEGPSVNDQNHVLPTPERDSGSESHDGSPISPTVLHEASKIPAITSGAESGADSEKSSRHRNDTDHSVKDGSTASDVSKKESSSAIWGSWRTTGTNGSDGPGREGGPLSGYQPAARGGRNMKVLKPHKTTSASVRTGTSYEPPTAPKAVGDMRRKVPAGGVGDSAAHASNRWDTRRAVSMGAEAKSTSQGTSHDTRNGPALPRAANPVGVASAFSWMTPPNKPKSSTAAE